MENKELWNRAMVDIELEVSKANFSTWFKNTRIMKQDSGTVFIGVQNEFVRDWLMKKYNSTILRTLRNLSEQVRGVEYLIAKDDAQDKNRTTARRERSRSEQSSCLHPVFILSKASLPNALSVDSAA